MKKKTYLMPELTVVDFCCERGFAVSGIMGLPQPDMIELLNYESGSPETETFSSRSGWGEDDNHFWEK